jgi:hypothetical protein
MTISPDDAHEMLETVGAIEQRVLDVATQHAIGPGLVSHA